MRGTNAKVYKILTFFIISFLVLGYLSAPADAKHVSPPAQPTGLAVSANTLTQTAVKLTWAVTSGATSYYVYKNGSLYGSAITTNTASITGLTASTLYTFTVLASNSGGSSAQSAGLPVTTLPNAPAAPTSLAVSANTLTQTTVTLTWATTTGATSYNVYENGSKYSSLVQNTSVQITGLIAGTTYSFTVSAVNAGGEGTQSAAYSVTTLIGVPTGLTVSSVTQTSATLSWAAATGATSYNVYKNGIKFSSLVTNTSAPITGLTVGTTYSFTVSAVNSGGEGAQSSALSVTTLPAVPTAIAVSAVTQTTATLSWAAVTGATSYNVYENGNIYSSLVTNTSLPLTGLTASTTYSFTLSAVNAGGASAQSTALSVTTSPRIPLNVLEVQPGTTYDLTASLLSGTFPNNTINITQMPMAEFISKVDEINGEYDIVYIGNNTTGGSYTALGSGSSALNLPEGGTNGQNSQEYYSDNDITNRRAATLMNFVNSKQLTIFDQSIFVSSLNKTKLYANFNSYKNNSVYPNFLTVTTSTNKSPNLTTAFSAYNGSNVAKRPGLTLNSQPVQYDGTDTSYQTNTSLGYNYSINNQTTATNMTVKLYLDINGDGIFKAAGDYAGQSELESETDNLSSGTGYTLNYQLPDSFVGLEPWKLELTDNSTGAKSYVIGTTAFKASGPAGELQIRVLQLEPSQTISANADDNHLSIYSLSNVNGQNLLHKANVYNIQVTEMYIKDFNAAYANLTGTQTPQPATAIVNGQSTTAPTALNGQYDMVIMGFADVYGGQSYSDLTNANSIKALQSFINTNQSVLLTHDTLSFSPDYLPVPSSYDPNNPSNISSQAYGYNITKYFRNIVGQQRYFQSPTAYQDPMPSSSKPSFGFSNYALARGNNGVNNDGQTFQTTTQVQKINDNLVTQFPFVLGDIPVSPTHFQYYQLNLEDESVVPVYALTNDSSATIYNKPGDGRNAYYTYTKGNITYSGTGHSLVNGLPEEEMFVNTMIKASRGANHAPTLAVNGISNGMNIANTSPSINFSFTATDIDPSDQYLNANINLATSTDGTTFSPYTTVQQFSSQDSNLTNRVKSGVPRAVSVNTSNSIIKAYEVQVVITDNEGAQVSSNGIIINSVGDPQITPQSPNNLACLVGDTLSIPVTVSATQTGLNETFKSINLQGIKTNPSGAATTVLSSGTISYPNIIFTPAPSWSTQSNNYPVTFTDVGPNTILTKLNYTAYVGTSQTGIARENDQTTGVQVGSGNINVIVQDTGNKGIKNVPLVISGPFQNGSTNTTIASGSASFMGLGSGNYTVSMTVPDGYAIVGSTSKTVTLSVSSPDQNITFTLTQLISTISPTTATFDKNIANTVVGLYADIAVTMTLNGNSLTSIMNGSTALNLGSDYTVSGSNVILSKTYLSTLTASSTPTNLAFTFSSGNTQVLGITVSDSTPPTINPTTATFDKNSLSTNYVDETVNMTLYAATLSGIKNGATTLNATSDYTVSGSTVTILKAYLVAQSVGTTNLTFTFSDGSTKTLVVTVSDSTPPTISPMTATFDKNSASTNYVNKTVNMTLYAATLSSIMNGTLTLNATSDYIVSGSTVTIQKTYLATQSVGTTNLTFTFSDGSTKILAVTVSDSTSPTISPTTAIFDKNSASTNYVDETVNMTLYAATLSSIMNGTTTLNANSDYTVSGGTVTILKGYLAGQSVGTTNLTFTFSDGSTQTLAVTVIDSTSPTISPTTATFDKYSAGANYVDETVNMTLYSATLSSIMNGTTTLNANSDYTVSGSTVTILKGYLAGQIVGTTNLTFTFSDGSIQTLAVTVIDSTPTILISNLSLSTLAGAHKISILPGVPIQAIVGLDLSRPATNITMDFRNSNVIVALSNGSCYCDTLATPSAPSIHQLINFSNDSSTNQMNLTPIGQGATFLGGTYTFNALISNAGSNLTLESIATALDKTGYTNTTVTNDLSDLTITVGTAPPLH